MKKLSIVLVAFCFLSTAVLARGYYGVRPMGMGGAFTGIADDANASFWNPAGMAINPGVDIAIGDNNAGIKMCFEAEVNPFVWILGIGAVSVLALEGAHYLSDQGVVQKNWGREGEKTSKGDSMAQEVKAEGGAEVKTDVHAQALQKAQAVAKDMADKAKNVEISVIIPPPSSPYYWPLYHRNQNTPTYWDNRPHPTGKAQFALGFNLMTDKNETLDQNTNWYTMTVASGYEEVVALGANINIYDLSLVSDPNIKGFGAGLDLGLLVRPIDKFSLGLAAKEILTTDIRWSNNATTRYEMLVNAGAALKPIPNLTLALDVHNIFRQNNSDATLHLGAEFRPIPGVALRGGLSDNSKTAGASIGFMDLFVDYAYLGGAFGRTQMLGLTYKM